MLYSIGNELIVHSYIEEVFEILETADVVMLTAHSSTLIDPIINRNFGIHFITRMDQTNSNTSINIQVNSINPDYFKYSGNNNLHT